MCQHRNNVSCHVTSCLSSHELLQSIMGAGNLSRDSRRHACWDWLIFQKLNSTGDSPLFSVLSFTAFHSASFFLTQTVPLFSLNVSFSPLLFFFNSSRFWPFSFSLCISCSSSSLSILTRHLFWPYLWVIWLCSLNLFLNTFFILTSTVLVWGEENRVLYGIHAECKEKNHSVKTHWPNPKRQADRTELWN